MGNDFLNSSERKSEPYNNPCAALFLNGEASRIYLATVACERNRVRTAPLWGVRLRSRLMHDGVSVTLRDAILRHGGEADRATHDFRRLSSNDQDAVVEFLRSL